MANREDAARLKKGGALWNQWRRYSPDAWIDLSGADLSKVDLREVDLRRADLSEAYLMGTKLSGANLSGARLYNTYLRGVSLIRSNLTKADLRDAFLREVDLRGARLINTVLMKARLQGANLEQALVSEWSEFPGSQPAWYPLVDRDGPHAAFRNKRCGMQWNRHIDEATLLDE
jgi:uncharacterized protein YjbI with pentapeptide repeats